MAVESLGMRRTIFPLGAARSLRKYTRDFLSLLAFFAFLTAPRGSCSVRGLFLVLSVTRPKPPLGQIVSGTSSHATCDVY